MMMYPQTKAKGTITHQCGASVDTAYAEAIIPKIVGTSTVAPNASYFLRSHFGQRRRASSEAPESQMRKCSIQLSGFDEPPEEVDCMGRGVVLGEGKSLFVRVAELFLPPGRRRKNPSIVLDGGASGRFMPTSGGTQRRFDTFADLLYRGSRKENGKSGSRSKNLALFPEASTPIRPGFAKADLRRRLVCNNSAFPLTLCPR